MVDIAEQHIQHAGGAGVTLITYSIKCALHADLEKQKRYVVIPGNAKMSIENENSDF